MNETVATVYLTALCIGFLVILFGTFCTYILKNKK